MNSKKFSTLLLSGLLLLPSSTLPVATIDTAPPTRLRDAFAGSLRISSIVASLIADSITQPFTHMSPSREWWAGLLDSWSDSLGKLSRSVRMSESDILDLTLGQATTYLGIGTGACIAGYCAYSWHRKKKKKIERRRKQEKTVRSIIERYKQSQGLKDLEAAPKIITVDETLMRDCIGELEKAGC